MGRRAPAVLLQELPDVLLKKQPDALGAAAAALDRGDDPAAIAALAKAWSGRRSPKLAELVELIDARLPERPFAELIATKADTTRKRLAAADANDPRLASVLLDLLEHPKFLTDRALWNLVLARLAECADPRLCEPGTRKPLGALRAVVFARLSPAALRDHVVKGLDAVAQHIPRVKAATAAQAAIEAAIEQRLGGAKAKRDAEDEILREIYNDPLADGPRQVYADLLSERGDPRGELITLQFTRRDQGLDESQKARERWLLKQHMKEWLDGLAPAISNTQSYSKTTFERGFVAIADIYLSAEKQLPNTWSEAGWATVEELRGPHQLEILQHAPLRGLRRLGGDTRVVTLAEKRPEKFRHVETLDVFTTAAALDHAPIRASFAALEGFPALRSVTISFGSALLLENVAWLVSETPMSKRVQRLVLGANTTRTPDTDRVGVESILTALETIRGEVPSLAIMPPWTGAPKPAPIELVRTETGYRRP